MGDEEGEGSDGSRVYQEKKMMEYTDAETAGQNNFYSFISYIKKKSGQSSLKKLVK